MGDDLRYWVGFNLARGIGPVRLRALIEALGSIEAAWTASEAALRATKLNDRAIESVLQIRRRQDLDVVMAQIERLGVRVLTWESPDYPALLAQVDDAPPGALRQGRHDAGADEWAVAMVGAHQATVCRRESPGGLQEKLGKSRRRPSSLGCGARDRQHRAQGRPSRPGAVHRGAGSGVDRSVSARAPATGRRDG